MNFNGKLSKMLILSYNKDENEDPIFPPIPFPVMYNPTNYTRNLKVCYHKHTSDKAGGTQQGYLATDDGEVSFEFLFDATGASVNSIQGQVAKALGNVSEQIDLFHKLTQQKDKDAGQNRYLTLVWGTFVYYCRLQTSRVEYTLFGPQGEPLRATIHATFAAEESLKKQAALDKVVTAALTKVHLVKAGEKLYSIAKKVYGDPKYYLEIARVNGLRNFRSLPPGIELILPAIDKRGN